MRARQCRREFEPDNFPFDYGCHKHRTTVLDVSEGDKQRILQVPVGCLRYGSRVHLLGANAVIAGGAGG
jgi:hypothetical protein